MAVSIPVDYSENESLQIGEEENIIIPDAISFDNEKGNNDVMVFPDKWPQFLDLLFQNRPHLASFLALGHIGFPSPTVIDITFSPNHKFQYNEIAKKQNREELQRLLHDFAKCEIECRIVLESKPIDHPPQNYMNQFTGGSHMTINDEIEQEPIIQTILDIFDGEILK